MTFGVIFGLAFCFPIGMAAWDRSLGQQLGTTAWDRSLRRRLGIAAK